MYIAKSSHLWSHILLLFFMLSKAFSMKVVDSCTTKSKQPITAGDIDWITDELGTRQFSVALGGLVQAVGALRITKPDKTDIPNAWYVYWDTPTWVNGYFNDVFDPTVKDPPKWVGEDPYTYTNPYNVVNVPESQPLAVNMDLYTDCFTDQGTKELNCFRCNVVVKTQAPPSAVARQLNKGVNYPEPWLAGLFKSKKGQQ